MNKENCALKLVDEIILELIEFIYSMIMVGSGVKHNSLGGGNQIYC